MKGKRTIVVLALAAAAAALIVKQKHDTGLTTHTVYPVHQLYVGVGGADSGKCSLSAPCASLAYATSQASPGDTVVMEAGTYGPQSITGSGTATAPLTITTSGTVTLTRPTPASDASQQTPLLAMHNVTYLTIGGLTLLGMKGRADYHPADYPGGDPTQAELIDNSGGGAWDTYLTLDHLTIEHSAAGCIKLPAHDVVTNSTLLDCGATGDTLAHGIYCAGGNDTITGNLIRTVSGYGIHCHGTTPNEIIRNNTVSDAAQAGILAEGAGTVISGNTVHDNGWGMTVAPGMTITSNLIYHNTRDNGGQHGYGILFASEGNDIIENNTFYQNGLGELYLANGSVTAPVTVLNNILDGSSTTDHFFNGAPTPATGSQIDYNLYLNLDTTNTAGSHSIWGDPRFLRPGVNFHLGRLSRALGTARPVRLPFGTCGRNRGAIC